MFPLLQRALEGIKATSVNNYEERDPVFGKAPFPLLKGHWRKRRICFGPDEGERKALWVRFFSSLRRRPANSVTMGGNRKDWDKSRGTNAPEGPK